MNVKERLQSATHQSLRRCISFFLESGDSSPSNVWDRSRPRDCARREERPSSAHDASAFMSFSNTKPVMQRAWIESRFGLARAVSCLLYTTDAADDMQCVELGGRRIIKKK